MEGRVGTRAHFRRKKYLNIYYIDTFLTNFIYCMPTFRIKIFSRCFAIIQKVMFTIRGKLTTRSAVPQNQPICYVTSAIFANDVTSVYADFLLTPFCPYPQKLIHCFAMNELKMTKLRNSDPEGIACVLLFSSRLSNDGRICTWVYSVGRLFVLPVVNVRVETSCWFNGEASAFRVNLFQLLYSAVGRLEGFIMDAFGVKPSEWLQSVFFIGGYLSLLRYKDEFDKRGIGEVQWLFQSNAWYKQQ